MGANFQTMNLDGALDHKAVKEAFEKAQDEDRYENGHSYSGGFGMASGLLFHGDNTFPTDNAAEEYLNGHCQKWDEAIAVKYLADADKVRWMIGAVCAS